ncbi:MAG: DUF1549 domain-containing protein [Verrucomicrobia bacterium]|nr:DUF1549 domain-containing protein [Verrucomicrobiota bacterium]
MSSTFHRFRGWILAWWLGMPLLCGAAEPHWAYQPLAPLRPPVRPETRHPVDAFVRARLDQVGLTPAPEADRATLLRRVSFDLIGLPPTPEELRTFLADPAPDAYERVVDRLLASPRYGERWARHWMDAAHFAETHGHDQDRIRTQAWPYRDYLVTAFNSDLPYARFIQEQVAGDVLFPTEPRATVALGFIAAGPWDESSLRDIREDTLDRQIGRYLDRDDMVTTVMSVVTSTTVHCARCHDHKFDPVSQRDYYALQAVFAGVERANRTFDVDPAVHVQRQALRREQRRVEQGDDTLLNSPEHLPRLIEWERIEAARVIPWTVLEPQILVSTGGATLKRLADQSVLATGTRPERDTYVLTTPLPSKTITAVRLEVLPEDSLPQKGPGRADNGNLHLTEFQVQLFEPGATQARELVLTEPSADFNQADWTIAHALDGQEKTAWGIHPQVGQAHQAAFRFKEPLTAPAGSTLVFTLKQLHGGSHLLGRVRLAVTDSTLPVHFLPEQIVRILGTPSDQRTSDQRRSLTFHVLAEHYRTALAQLPPPGMVYAAAADFEPDGGLKPSPVPREVKVLRRGEITKPMEVAEPGALSCVTSLPARFELANLREEGLRRAALAEWLTAAENPLTWRSIVNRVWQHHFGRGLVDTANDFGKMGGTPSHPELLDWLAVWFRDDARGSFKELHRLLVTSATYRQSTVPSQPAPTAQTDADNRWLSHMNRTRLDAEAIRDTLLWVSGRLDSRMGGPSDRQFDLKPGIHVTPRVDYTVFDVDSAEGSRRSIYRFLFRTLPDPFFEALDCPAGDQLTAVRNNSVTVQQALALWNNAVVARLAEHFAHRLAAEEPTVESQIRQACEQVWGRPPQPDEAADLVTFTREHGLPNLCRLLFNSNEFVFVN